MNDRRNLDVPGCANLRDLGGCTTRRGEVLRIGREMLLAAGASAAGIGRLHAALVA